MPEKRETPEGAERVVLQDPHDKAKADCLNPNPQRCKQSHSLLQRLQRSVPRGQTVPFCGLPPPTGRAMGSEPIEGDEWDAYVMLDTFNANGTRDGLTGASPRVTESS